MYLCVPGGATWTRTMLMGMEASTSAACRKSNFPNNTLQIHVVEDHDEV